VNKETAGTAASGSHPGQLRGLPRTASSAAGRAVRELAGSSSTVIGSPRCVRARCQRRQGL